MKAMVGSTLVLFISVSVLHCGPPDGQAILNAAKRGDTEKVLSLLDQGVDIEAKDSYGATALMLAAYEGHQSTVRALLEAGADPGAQDQSGNTVITVAEAQGHLQIVDLVKGYL